MGIIRKEKKMRKSYCTLFDSSYLDKGTVTIGSLLAHNQTCQIYILCMDDKCVKILEKEYRNNKRVQLISVDAFLKECQDLKTVKDNRSHGEFCWSSASSLILYILDCFQEECVTYIDADMYFYNDPDVLVDEMIENEKEVQIMEHRFKEDFVGNIAKNYAGRFCVEFNTFLNTESARIVLKKWISDVVTSCVSDPEAGASLGDQGYLDEWPEKYDCVHINQNAAAGIAPWNIDRYRICRKNSKCVCYDGRGEYKPIFFHFHGIKYETDDLVNIGLYTTHWFVSDRLVDAFYKPYLLRIEKKKKYLKEKYNIYPVLRKHPAYKEEVQSEKKRRRLADITPYRIYFSIRRRTSNALRKKLFEKKDYIDLTKL